MMIKNERNKSKKEQGITLIALVITVIILIILSTVAVGALFGDNGLISNARYAAFATKVRGYQEYVNMYVLEKQLEGESTDIKINVTDKEEIKKIIPGITDEDAEKYVIQENELRYNPDTVTEQEEIWLIQLGILAMTAITLFTITYMANGSIYQTVQSETIAFPEIDPTSSQGNFAGWYYEQEGTNQAIEGTEVIENITLYAKWENFKITFMFNGEVYSEISNDENKVIYPSTNPVHPQGDGFTFNGWYTSENGTGSVSNGATVSKDTVLYPGWTVDFVLGESIAANANQLRDVICSASAEDIMNSFILDIINKVFDVNLSTTGEIEAFQEIILQGMIELTEEKVIEFASLYVEELLKTSNIYMYGYNGGAIGLLFRYNNKENIIKYELLDASVNAMDGYNPDIWHDISNFVSVDDMGAIIIKEGTEYSVYRMSGSVSIKVTYNDGKEDIIVIDFSQEFPCLAEGTLVTLADRSKKKIEDITYEDKLLVWDFDNGCFAEAKPLWIKKKQVAEEYNLVKFDNGVELKTVADHRIFNVETQKFTYTMNEEDTPIGTSTFMEDGTIAKIVEREVVRETVNYYNIITDYHMNLFANGILTSLRLNNLYKIEDMKFVKDNRELASREEYARIPDKYFYGLRLAEQPREINRGNDVKHTNTLTEYVERIMKIEK